jgi:hypothetical protein
MRFRFTIRDLLWLTLVVAMGSCGPNAPRARTVAPQDPPKQEHKTTYGYTSLQYYRPRTPPAVTADNLSRFIAALRDTRALTDSGLFCLQVKFGQSIDQDEKDANWLENIADGIATTNEVQWDINVPNPSGLQEMIDRLAGDQRRVYRAYIDLGTPTDEVLKPITRTNSPENEVDFCPDSISIELGPVHLHTLASDQPALVGWISIHVSGYGYLYPWTLRDTVARLESTPATRHIMDACRSFWPVSSPPPDAEILKLRRQVPELWPYEDYAKPWDWYWGVNESG